MNDIAAMTPSQLRRRNLALAVVVAAYILSFFQRFAPAGIVSDLSAAFQTSAASLGVLAATYFYIYTLMQIPTGILVDTLGPRRILLLGGLVAGGGSLMFGMAQSLDAALIGRTLIGLGVSVVFIAMLKIIAVWYEDHRFASMVGLCLLLGNFGSVLAGSPLSWAAQTSGWRSVFVVVGVFSIILALLGWLLVRDRLPQDEQSATRSGFDRTAVFAAMAGVLKNRATWPTVVVNAGLGGSFFAFGGLWATPFLMQVMDMSRAAATGHLSLFFASFAIGSLVIGALSDRLRQRKPVILISAHLYGLIWLLLLSGLVLPLAITYPLFCLMGLTNASFTLTWACAKEVNPPALSGMSTALTNMGCFLMAAILQPAVGVVLDQRWDGAVTDGVRMYTAEDYRWALLLVAIFAWIGAAAAWRIRETHCRNIWHSIADEA